MRVLVVGAGIAGLSLAIALRSRGHDVLVVERYVWLRDEGYLLDFFGPGIEAAATLGLTRDLERIHAPVQRWVFLSHAGRERFSLPYPAIRQRLFDNRHFTFVRGALERVLHDRLAASGVIRFGVNPAKILDRGSSVRTTLSDGMVVDADLVVGADGIHSGVRDQIFGLEERYVRRLGYSCAAFTLDRRDQFGLPPDAQFTQTEPGRQVSICPVPGGGLAVQFVYRSALANGSGREGGGSLARLRAAFSGSRGLPPILLGAMPERDVYTDEVVQVEMPAWSRGRVALLGDACQAVSVLADQGASMAMTAACILAEELEDERPMAEALGRYEQRLRPLVQRKQAAGRSLTQWLAPSSQARIALRDLALRASVWPVASRLVRWALDAPGARRTGVGQGSKAVAEYKEGRHEPG